MACQYINVHYTYSVHHLMLWLIFLSTASVAWKSLTLAYHLLHILLLHNCDHNEVFRTSEKGGGKCFCLCSFVCLCLSVSKITQKRVHGFGWNVACWQMSGHGPTELLSPIRIIVRMPEPDCYLRYRISAATQNFTSGKSHWQNATTVNRGFKSRLTWSWVGGRLAPFYIHQMNRVNSRNGSAMMTAP